jgi:hypothetical protein
VAQFDPTPRELSTIEVIETVYNDREMPKDERKQLLQSLWAELEKIHRDTVLMLRSPEGQLIHSPFQHS